ncbi:MAG: hypothetical protein K0S37_4403 [Microbacterium sp.]|nr:hypothetical protein [Microbacterium sp.]
MKRSIRKAKLALAAVAVGSLITFAAPHTATAAQPVEEAAPPTSSESITQEEFREALVVIEGSDIDRTEVVIDGSMFYKYTVEGAGLTLPSVSAFDAAATAGEVPDDVITPMAEVRSNGQYVAIGFNNAEQAALAGGGGAALQLAICALAVPACGVAIIAIAAAVGYVSANGFCGSNQLLWWYDVRGGSTVQCRSTVPPGY